MCLRAKPKCRTQNHQTIQYVKHVAVKQRRRTTIASQLWGQCYALIMSGHFMLTARFVVFEGLELYGNE